MKNILYIGQYKDNTGLGQSCRRFIDYIGSNTKYNLAIRPLYLTQTDLSVINNLDKHIEYENNSIKSYDTLIQHTTPDYIEYNKNYGKNIAIVEVETNNIRQTGWVDNLNLVDEIWVGSKFSALSLHNSGVIKPIRIVPEPYDINNYLNNNLDSFFSYQNSTDKPFIFYTIGQYGEKKNIKSIIFAYLLEFSKKDNVRLFIKTCDHRRKNEDLENIIKYDIDNIKHILRKNNDDYPDIDILCGYMSDQDVIRLHQSSDCYINTVKGDSFGSSAIEAALCDNLIINTKNIGSSTYFNGTNALMVNSTESIVLHSNSNIKNAYTIYEKWFEPSINEIQNAMRKATMIDSYKKTELKSNFDKTIFTYDTINELIT